MKQKMGHFSDQELVDELIERSKKNKTDIIVLLADNEKEDIHFHSPLDSACRMAALLFSAIIDMFSQRFSLTRVQGRELLYESLNKLLVDRINFFGKNSANPNPLQKIH